MSAFFTEQRTIHLFLGKKEDDWNNWTLSLVHLQYNYNEEWIEDRKSDKVIMF